MWEWWNGIVSGEIQTRVNPSSALLIERTIQKFQGKLSSRGALCVNSGKFTGRAAEDKYVVRNKASEKIIDWNAKIHELDDQRFNELKIEMLKKIHLLKPETFIVEVSAGADPMYSLGVNLITTSPVHAFFCQQIMRAKRENNSLGSYVIYHDPTLEFDAKKYGLRSSTVIAINFESREILIGGTAYCGEIKKAIFSVMNTILPDYGVLPVHSGANMGQGGKVSVFFGLSGTGKTTLSADVGLQVIGDDEHGISERGIFNFEGGCYAKTYKLTESGEPQIFHAVNRFGSLMENVVLDPETREPKFDDKSITENGRATYPLGFLDGPDQDGRGEIPSDFFFLSADAMGVLPAISSLSDEQAIYYFLLGYTAKVAGTEIGLKGVTATFSHCFGAPFMMRPPIDYGVLLKEFLHKHKIKVWLVNTGWYGGSYGEGKRYSLDFTRNCIRAIQRGLGPETSFTTDPVFSLRIPDYIEGIDINLLNPHLLWKDPEEYFKTAKDLKQQFDHNYSKVIKGTTYVVSHQENSGLYGFRA